jgi:shikimate dehydrogenase
MITGTTRLYAIVGDPVGHVRTPMAFNDYFAANGIDAACVAIHIGRDDIAVGWPGLKAIRNLDGFIVTAPYKAEAAALCDALEGDGAYTKVVNTVRREVVVERHRGSHMADRIADDGVEARRSRDHIILLTI